MNDFNNSIKIFFQENASALGNVGPASSTIWGYGLTALSLFLMIFMSLYLSKRASIEDGKSNILENEGNFFTEFIKMLMNDSLPIVLTLGIVIWIIYLNFTYFERINKNNSKQINTIIKNNKLEIIDKENSKIITKSKIILLLLISLK